jgi:dTDP-4-dehydrorhamnose reductase
MKILILGGDGMLGHMAVKYFKSKGYDVVSTTRGDNLNNNKIKLNLSNFNFDLNNLLSQNVLEEWIPDYIINCIGIIKPYSEKNIEETIFINSMFPHILSRQAKIFGVKVIHVTTDCVYSGLSGKYTEEDKFDPLDVYGKTKSLGEPSDCFVLRTSIIGPEIKGKLSLLEWFFKQKDKEINGFQNHFWNGITTLECSKIIEQIIKNNLYENGTKHVFSNIVSKYDMVNTFKEVYDINVKINKIDAKDFCDRTLSTINKDFLNKLDIKDFKNMIFEMRDFYEKN